MRTRALRARVGGGGGGTVMSRTILSVSLVTDRPELTKFVTISDTLVVTLASIKPWAVSWMRLLTESKSAMT